MAETRIGLLGPRRARQGLGPWLGRFADEAGARLTACAGIDPDRIHDSAKELATAIGHEVRGYVGLENMLRGEDGRGEPLSALIIASPTQSHEKALRTALEAKLHVLCEKPLVFGSSRSLETAQELCRAFLAQGLQLMVNTQWPYTLPSYFELFPEVRGVLLHSFFMRLSPFAAGRRMLPDALPHPLSLLQSLLPDEAAVLFDPKIRILDAESGSVEIEFRYGAQGKELEVRIDLLPCEQIPRSAAYGINGHIAERYIQLPEYRLYFHAKPGALGSLAHRSLAQEGGIEREGILVPDPTRALVADFVQRLESGLYAREECGTSIVQRLRMLDQLWHCYP